MRLRLLIVGLLVLGSIELFAVGAAAGGGGCGEVVPTEASSTDEIVMRNACFVPGFIAASVGDTIHVVNRDGFEHNLYGRGWALGSLQAGDRAAYRFDSPGAYSFACSIHPSMTGVVMVDDPDLIAARAPIAPGSDSSGSGDMALAGLALGTGLVGGVIAGCWWGRRRSLASA